MKKSLITIKVALTGITFMFMINNCSAQFLKKLKNQVTETVKQTVQQRSSEKAGNATNTAIDKTTSAVGSEASKVLNKHKNSGQNENQNTAGNNIPDANPDNAINATSEGNDVASAATIQTDNTSIPADYTNYDFVPGDKIIFQPDLSTEPDAELPARFTIKAGTAEIQSYEGEKILHLQPNAKTAVEPLMSSEKYLPEQFTLEFDMMYENPDGDYFRYASDFRVGFAKIGNQNYYNGGLYSFVIDGTSKCSLGETGNQTFSPALQQSFGRGNTWHHIAIYIRKNIGKAYIDAYRVCATNALPAGTDKFYIKADRYGIKIKNLRLAAGGDDKYNKIVTDGKFITHGILFDVNQSTIKPESMGALNEIARLMQDHADLKFEIDGHTDSDGNDDANMKLSQERADAVKTELTTMGVSADRLSTKGFGETKPLDKNDSAEGKANNRRVEFIKM